MRSPLLLADISALDVVALLVSFAHRERLSRQCAICCDCREEHELVHSRKCEAGIAGLGRKRLKRLGAVDVVDVHGFSLFNQHVQSILKNTYLQLSGRSFYDDGSSYSTRQAWNCKSASRSSCSLQGEVGLLVLLVEQLNCLLYKLLTGLSVLGKDDTVNWLKYDTLVVDVLNFA